MSLFSRSATSPLPRAHAALAHLGAVLAILLGTGFLRLVQLGGLPKTDEGVYAYAAQSMHASLAAGQGLPGSGTLMLYPLLTAWLFSFSANHLLLLRCADLLVALAFSWQLYRVVLRESASWCGATLITLIFLFAINHPVFIQNGYKNSIVAALLPLLLAVRLGQMGGTGPATWCGIGALVALSVLLREPFIAFLPIALGAAALRGRRSLLMFCLGAAILGTLILGAACVARGGVHTLIAGYRDAGQLYAAVGDQRLQLFLGGARQAVNASALALAAAMLGLLAAALGVLRRSPAVSPWHLLFWGSTALVPLLEPATKIGFPYHFAVCLPGLAGIAALGWRSMTTLTGARTASASAAAVVAALLVILPPQLNAFSQAWPATLATLRSAASGAWPDADLPRSNYLLAADAIKKAAPPNASLSVSGFMLALYPLTGLLPRSDDLSNLSTTIIALDLDTQRLKQALLRCPPDLVMSTTREEFPGAVNITAAILATGIYTPVAVIPVATDREYGSFAGTLYRRSGPAHPPCSRITGP